jgi:hypothetical protein
MIRLCFLIVLLPTLIVAQSEVWYSYIDTTTELLGFKNSDGQTVIEPNYVLEFTQANQFNQIVSVLEEKDGNWDSFYISKSGKNFGLDSVYIWDNLPDCEREGLIRFRDRNTDKVGFFNAQGKIVIPAEYNDAKPFINGLSLVIQNATKTCWSNEVYDHKNPCEHWSWVGGETMLINLKNEVLTKEISIDSSYQYHSLAIDKNNLKDRDYFESKNGSFSLINTKREFSNWFLSEFQNDIVNPLFLFEKVTVWNKDQKQWIVNNDIEILENKISDLRNIVNQIKESNMLILENQLNNYLHNGKFFESYYDNCGQHLNNRYPVFGIGIATDKQNGYHEVLEFLRTAQGYKLITISTQ